MNIPDNFPPVKDGHRGLWYGGDYNPEQWQAETWKEDARLMDLAHWNVATVGVFSWVSLEPKDGEYAFAWLDEVMNELQARGRKTILATPSAAPPAWLSQAHPEILRVGDDGVRRRHGNRVNTCITSPVYRERCRGMAERLAKRYGKHDSLALWHISNEFGGACYCDLCAQAFREWLKDRFKGDLDLLNNAYWASFWGHTFTDWSQIEIPGPPHGETAMQGLTLDWRRFVTDQTIACYQNEAGPLREHAGNIPITTNFMGFYPGLDYRKFAKVLDVISWDSYPAFSGRLELKSTWITLAATHDLNRSLKDGQPFLLMESTPSSSNWYPAMALKSPGMQDLEGIQAIAHGSESVQYFQWRQSRGCQEQFHGAIVAHEGSEKTRVFKDVAALGAKLARFGEIAGATVKAEAAILYDWETLWAVSDSCGQVKGDRPYFEALRAFYEPFLMDGIAVDIVGPDVNLDQYKLFIAPMMFLVHDGLPERLEKWVENGGIFATTYWSGIVDENALCFTGGFPGPLRKLLGIWSEELDVLYPEDQRSAFFEPQNVLGLEGAYKATQFCDLIHPEGAEVIARYGDGFYTQMPALTVNKFGKGEALYVASKNDASFHVSLGRVLALRAKLQRAVNKALPEGVIARKRSGEHEYLFLMNITNEEKHVELAEQWTHILNGDTVTAVGLPRYGTAVLRSAH